MKKVFTFMFLFMLIFSTYAQAHETEESITHEKEEENLNLSNSKPYIVVDKNDNTRRPTTCPYGNGICDAKSKGVGNVFVNGSFDFDGSCWQCTKCYSIYVTYYDPLLWNFIGDYAVASWYEEIPGTGANVYVNSAGYTSSASLPGVIFNY